MKLRRIGAAPEKVWSAVVDPVQLGAWFPDRVEGSTAVGSEGSWVFERFGLRAGYRVTAREEGLSITWEFSTYDQKGVVVFRLRPDGAGTIIEVTDHCLRTDPEERAAVESGWLMALATLEWWLLHEPGTQRSSWFALRYVEFDRKLITGLFRTTDGLARWLTADGGIGEEGTEFHLVLHDGTPISGRVLAHSVLETLLSWREQNALLTLKAFNYGPAGPAVGVHGFGYGMSSETAAEHEARFNAALARLIRCCS